MGIEEEKEVQEVRELLEQFDEPPAGRPPRDLTENIMSSLPRSSRERDMENQKVHWFLARIAAGIIAALVIWQIVVGRPEYDAETVGRALDWLAEVQEDSGEWDPAKWDGREDLKVGISSLATLALLGHHEEPFTGPHSAPVKKGIDFIVSQQNANGRFGPEGPNMMYNHGLATVALLEAYGMSRDNMLREPIEKAVGFIQKGQTETGGWGYLGLRDETANTSVSVWPLHALIMAHQMGWKETRESAKMGLAWLQSMTDEKGMVGYTMPGDFPNGPGTLTAMGMFYTALTGAGNTMHMRYLPETAKVEKLAFEPGTMDFYKTYFLTAVFNTANDSMSQYWTDNITAAIAKRQVNDGPHAGSWEPEDQWSNAGGRIYSTAMATLSLESERRIPRTMSWMEDTN